MPSLSNLNNNNNCLQDAPAPWPLVEANEGVAPSMVRLDRPGGHLPLYSLDKVAYGLVLWYTLTRKCESLDGFVLFIRHVCLAYSGHTFGPHRCPQLKRQHLRAVALFLLSLALASSSDRE